MKQWQVTAKTHRVLGDSNFDRTSMQVELSKKLNCTLYQDFKCLRKTVLISFYSGVVAGDGNGSFVWE
jgi:hypothetical protein